MEPNCKNHSGGIRDLDYMHWVCKALGISTNPFFLRKYLKVSCHEIKEYRKQLFFLSSIRHYLHIITQRREDTLHFEYQPIIAQHLHYFNNTHQLAQEQLMHTYFRATRSVTQLLKQFQFLVDKYINPSRQNSNINEYKITNNSIDVSDEYFFIKSPNKIFEIFYLLNIYEDFSLLTQRALFKVKNLIDNQWKDDTRNKHLFIRLLKSPKISKILNALHEHSILGKYLTPFRSVTGQLQHDLLHIYTVDQHTLKVIDYLNDFTKREHIEEYGYLNEIITNFKNYWLIYLSALFHDLGKGKGGNHSLIGEQYIKEFCDQHNISIKQTKLLMWLVKNHLILSYCSQKQDFHQEGIVENFCHNLNVYIASNKKIKNKYKAKVKQKIKANIPISFIRNKQKIYVLQALYILTIADIKGTNPKAYNTWRAYLIDSFYNACMSYLTNKSRIKSISVIPRQQQALMNVDSILQERVIDWFSSLNKSFFIRKSIEDIAWIANNIAQQKDLFTTSIYINQKTKIEWQIWIHTPDINFLFAHICKILAKQNINIMHADLDSTKYKYAINSIEVDCSNYINAYDIEDSNKYVQELIDKLLYEIKHIDTENLEVPHNLHIQHYSPRIRQFLGQSKVNILLQKNHYALHIKTIDQLGLLYKISCVLAKNMVSIRQAHILTMGESVEDTFFIESSNLRDANFLTNLEIQILRSLN